MAAEPTGVIPASAQCKYGPKQWTMLYQPGRLELSFPSMSGRMSGLGWWIVTVTFAVGFALYAWASYGILLAMSFGFSWEKVAMLGVISVIFWASFFTMHPRGRMVVQKLVIEKGMINATGLVFGRSVFVEVPIAAVTNVDYQAGFIGVKSARSAQIEIYFVQPHRTMRFPRRAADELALCNWICTAVGKPRAER